MTNFFGTPQMLKDGIVLIERDRLRLQTALEREPSHLFMHRFGHLWRAGGASPRLSAPGFQLANEDPSKRLGRQMAQSVYGSMGGR
jgi:hypothetical protein